MYGYHKYRSLPFFSPTCVTSNTFFHTFFRRVYFSQAVKRNISYPAKSLFVCYSNPSYNQIGFLPQRKERTAWFYIPILLVLQKLLFLSVVVFIPISYSFQFFWWLPWCSRTKLYLFLSFLSFLSFCPSFCLSVFLSFFLPSFLLLSFFPSQIFLLIAKLANDKTPLNFLSCYCLPSHWPWHCHSASQLTDIIHSFVGVPKYVFLLLAPFFGGLPSSGYFYSMIV